MKSVNACTAWAAWPKPGSGCCVWRCACRGAAKKEVKMRVSSARGDADPGPPVVDIGPGGSHRSISSAGSVGVDLELCRCPFDTSFFLKRRSKPADVHLGLPSRPPCHGDAAVDGRGPSARRSDQHLPSGSGPSCRRWRVAERVPPLFGTRSGAVRGSSSRRRGRERVASLLLAALVALPAPGGSARERKSASRSSLWRTGVAPLLARTLETRSEGKS